MSEKQMINDMNMQQQNCNKFINPIEKNSINQFNPGINIQSVNLNQVKNDVNNISCQNENDILSMANAALFVAKQTYNTVNTQKEKEENSNYTVLQDIKKLLEEVVISIAELNSNMQNNNQSNMQNNNQSNAQNNNERYEQNSKQNGDMNNIIEKPDLYKKTETLKNQVDTINIIKKRNIRNAVTKKIGAINKQKNVDNINKEILPVAMPKCSMEVVVYGEEQRKLAQKLKAKDEEYNKIWCSDIFTENKENFKNLLDISPENMTDNVRKKLLNRENKAKIMMEEKSEKIFSDFSDSKIDEIKNYILKIASRAPKILSMYDIQKYIGYYKKEVNKRSKAIINIYIEYPEIFDALNYANITKIKNYVIDKYSFSVFSTISVKNVENWIKKSTKIADINQKNSYNKKFTIKTEPQQIIEKILNRNKKLLGDFDFASKIQIKNEIIVKNRKCKVEKITLEYIENQIDKALEEPYIQPVNKEGRKRKTLAVLNKYGEKIFETYDLPVLNKIKIRVVNKSTTNNYAITIERVKDWFDDISTEVKREIKQKEFDEVINLITEKFKFVDRLGKNTKEILVQDYKEGNAKLDKISRKEFDNYVFDKVIKIGKISNKMATNFIKKSFNIQIEKNNEYAILIFEKLIEIKSKNEKLNFNITNKNSNYWNNSTLSLFITDNTIECKDVNALFYIISQMLCSIILWQGKDESWENIIFSVRNYYRDEDRNIKMNKKLRKVKCKCEKDALSQVLADAGYRTKEQYLKYLVKKINSKINEKIDSRIVANIGLNMSEIYHIEKLIENPKSINSMAKQKFKEIANNYYNKIWNIYNGNYNIISVILDAIFLGRNDIYNVFIPRGKGRTYFEKNYDGSDRKYSEILDVQFYEIISWYSVLKIINDFETIEIIKENFGEEFYNKLDQTVEKFL